MQPQGRASTLEQRLWSCLARGGAAAMACGCHASMTCAGAINCSRAAPLCALLSDDRCKKCCRRADGERRIDQFLMQSSCDSLANRHRSNSRRRGAWAEMQSNEQHDKKLLFTPASISSLPCFRVLIALRLRERNRPRRFGRPTRRRGRDGGTRTRYRWNTRTKFNPIRTEQFRRVRRAARPVSCGRRQRRRRRGTSG